jgi:ABC-2 type transport system ATP-binding protein
MSDIALRTRGLTKDFGAVRAVNDLTIEVPSGKIFGFLGPNGSGKTTTIHLLLGLLEPTGGSAEVLGFDTRDDTDELRAHTGALLEHHGLYETLTAHENLEFQGKIYGLHEGALRPRIEELLTQMGVWERRNEQVGEWSRGMKQRLAVARALLHGPQLLFLDEPTAGLDVVAATRLREDLAALVDNSGTTVFLTTHNMVEAEKLCSRIAVIRDGRLLTCGAPGEITAVAGKSSLEDAFLSIMEEEECSLTS